MMNAIEEPGSAGEHAPRGIDQVPVISLVIVDDHGVVREGLSAVLGSEPDMEIVGQAASAEEALALLTDVDPDVIVTDFRLPAMDAAGLLREVAERRLRARVVVLSGFLDDESVYSSLQAGAHAYVVKDVESSELKRAIRAVSRGETAIDPKVTKWVISWAARVKRGSPPDLRPSELQVLRLLAQQKTTREIAKETGLKPNTVKSYLAEVYVKLGVNSRAEALAAAVRLGLVSGPVSGSPAS